MLRRLSLPWNHCLLLSFFSLLSTLFSISAQPVWLAEEGREGGEKTNYPPFTPPPYPVRRLIAGYVHALCECLKQDMHKRIHGTLIRTVEGYYDDEGLTSHKGEAPYYHSVLGSLGLSTVNQRGCVTTVHSVNSELTQQDGRGKKTATFCDKLDNNFV